MIAGNDAHLPAGPLHEAGIVGGRGDDRPGLPVSALKDLTKETLRRLDASQGPAIRRVQHAALAVDHLDGVRDGKTGNDGGMTGSHTADDPGEQVRRRKAARDVVDQHDPVVGAKHRQTRLDGSRPIGASGHYVHPDRPAVASMVAGSDLAALARVGGRRHDDHAPHLTAAQNAPKCVSQ